MKNIYFFIALLTLSAGAVAKGEYEAMTTAGPVVNGKFPHFGSQVVNNIPGGGTAPEKISLRLVGRTYAAFSSNSFVPVDSYYYRYENERGGVLANDDINNDETLLYTESVHYKYAQSLGSYINQIRRTQDYYSNDKVKFLTYQPWESALNSWQDSARYAYTYDNGQMKSSTFEQYYSGMWTNGITSGISYTGQLVTAMESPVYKVAFSYDNNVNLVEMFDAQMVNGVWQNKEKHTYQYAGSNMSTHSLYQWNVQANAWVNSKKWEYTYFGNDVVTEIEMQWNGTTWVNAVKHEYSYDGKHNMTTDLKKIWNSSLGAFVEASREDWTYNSQSLPELITTSTWDGSAWMYTNNDKQYRLYYEYIFPAEVKKFADNNGLNVYPVPANEKINISLDLKEVQDVSISLIDVKGAVAYRSNYNAAKDLQASIPVAELPAGTYFLRVIGDGTDIARTIVIQH